MPAVLTPNTPLTPNLSVGGPMVSMTSKDRAIPPRPKPGRKSATGTSLTKRGAQNRAAQKAFRERKAAYVHKLEQELDQQKATHDEEKSALGEKARSLGLELQSWRSRCLLLENMLKQEREGRVRAEIEAELSKRQRNRRCSCRGSIASLPSTLPPTDHHGTGSIHVQQPVSRQRPDAIITNLSAHGAPPNSVATNGACGLYKDGTYCVYADTPVATPVMTSTDTLPPILH
jgi:hypothetical protein